MTTAKVRRLTIWLAFFFLLHRRDIQTYVAYFAKLKVLWKVPSHLNLACSWEVLGVGPSLPMLLDLVSGSETGELERQAFATTCCACVTCPMHIAQVERDTKLPRNEWDGNGAGFANRHAEAIAIADHSPPRR